MCISATGGTICISFVHVQREDCASPSSTAQKELLGETRVAEHHGESSPLEIQACLLLIQPTSWAQLREAGVLPRVKWHDLTCMPPCQLGATCWGGSIDTGPIGLPKRKPQIPDLDLEMHALSCPPWPRARAAPHVCTQKSSGLHLSKTPHTIARSHLGQSSFFLGRRASL